MTRTYTTPEAYIASLRNPAKKGYATTYQSYLDNESCAVYPFEPTDLVAKGHCKAVRAELSLIRLRLQQATAPEPQGVAIDPETDSRPSGTVETPPAASQAPETAFRPGAIPQCPNCGEPISQDNDYANCHICGESGCEECIDGEDGCEMCQETTELDRDLPGYPAISGGAPTPTIEFNRERLRFFGFSPYAFRTFRDWYADAVSHAIMRSECTYSHDDPDYTPLDRWCFIADNGWDRLSRDEQAEFPAWLGASGDSAYDPDESPWSLWQEFSRGCAEGRSIVHSLEIAS